MPLDALFALGCAAALWFGASETPRALLDRAPSPPAAAVAAVDLTGHWEADVTGDGRTFTFLFDFATKGDVLTGTVGLSTRDDTFPITDGRIKGDAISFKSFGMWTGTLVGSELKLTRELDYGRKQRMTARRKPKS